MSGDMLSNALSKRVGSRDVYHNLVRRDVLFISLMKGWSTPILPPQHQHVSDGWEVSQYRVWRPTISSERLIRTCTNIDELTDEVMSSMHSNPCDFRPHCASEHYVVSDDPARHLNFGPHMEFARSISFAEV
jgi:hypothetical protein